MHELEQGATDEDVQILAGLDATDYWEIKRYIEKIVGMELVESDYAHQNWAGKLIVELAEDYNSGAIGVVELDTIISKLYYKLGYPGWMTMLARNCEYATDIPAFTKPFQDELNYMAELWLRAEDLNDFNRKYDRRALQCA